MANAISAQLSMRFRLTGANYVIVAACSSAVNAIGTAFRMIRMAMPAASCAVAPILFLTRLSLVHGIISALCPRTRTGQGMPAV